MGEEKETDEQRTERIISERVTAALADAQTPDEEKRVQQIVDKAVAKALNDHLPTALDAFFDKLTSDDAPAGDNAPGGGGIFDFLFGKKAAG